VALGVNEDGLDGAGAGAGVRLAVRARRDDDGRVLDRLLERLATDLAASPAAPAQALPIPPRIGATDAP
jgi:hypothetical protein